MSLSILQICCPHFCSSVFWLGFCWVCKTGVYSFIGHIEFPKFQTRIFCWMENALDTVYDWWLVFICSVLGWQEVLIISKILKNTPLKGIMLFIYISNKSYTSPKFHLSIHFYLNVKLGTSRLLFTLKRRPHSCNYNKERQQYTYFCFGSKFPLFLALIF